MINYNTINIWLYSCSSNHHINSYGKEREKSGSYLEWKFNITIQDRRKLSQIFRDISLFLQEKKTTHVLAGHGVLITA